MAATGVAERVLARLGVLQFKRGDACEVYMGTPLWQKGRVDDILFIPIPHAQRPGGERVALYKVTLDDGTRTAARHTEVRPRTNTTKYDVDDVVEARASKTAPWRKATVESVTVEGFSGDLVRYRVRFADDASTASVPFDRIRRFYASVKIVETCPDEAAVRRMDPDAAYEATRNLDCEGLFDRRYADLDALTWTLDPGALEDDSPDGPWRSWPTEDRFADALA